MAKTSVEMMIDYFSNSVSHCRKNAEPYPGDEMVPTPQFLKTQELSPSIKTALSSIVRLCGCGRGCASACAVGRPNEFLTNIHAWKLNPSEPEKFKIRPLGAQDLEGCPDLTLITAEGKTYSNLTGRIIKAGEEKANDEGEVIDNNDSTDLLLIELKGASIEPLPLSSREVELGTKVFMGGFPEFIGGSSYVKQGEFKISSGVVTHKESYNHTGDFISMNGMSGACILNERGEVVGTFWGHADSSVWETKVWQPSPSVSKTKTVSPPPLPPYVKREQSYFIPLRFLREFLWE